MTKILHKIRLYINLCIQNSNNKVKIIDSKQCAGLNEKILCYCEEHGDIYSSIFRIKRAIFICPECNDKYYHDHQLQIKKVITILIKKRNMLNGVYIVKIIENI